jgi:hypothetical protein
MKNEYKKHTKEIEHKGKKLVGTEVMFLKITTEAMHSGTSKFSYRCSVGLYIFVRISC